MILGAFGACGLAGMAFVAGKQQGKRAKPSTSTVSSNDTTAVLANAAAGYWHAFALQEASDADEAEAARRREARDANIEALARVMASEAGMMSRNAKRTIAWIARNRSLLTEQTLCELVAPDGRWGPVSATRPFSSAQPADRELLGLASEILAAPQASDLTGGATHGFHSVLQDRLAAQGLAVNDARAVMRRWESVYGLTRIGHFDDWILYQ